jgi:hypothetical protein
MYNVCVWEGGGGGGRKREREGGEMNMRRVACNCEGLDRHTNLRARSKNWSKWTVNVHTFFFFFFFCENAGSSGLTPYARSGGGTAADVRQQIE